MNMISDWIQEPARDVQRNIRPIRAPRALEGDLAFDGAAEIAAGGRRDRRCHVPAQTVANVEMLAAHGKLHALIVT